MVWTADELERLERLSVEHQGENNLNIKLMEFFPGKTNKQISDAKRRLKSPTSIREQPNNTPSPHSESPNSEINDGSQRQVVIESEAWKEALRMEIAKRYCTSDKWQTIIDTMVKLEGTATQVGEIDLIYGILVRQLDIQNKKTATKASKRSKRRVNRIGPPNRTARRYAYAKCQELMNKCLKKLAKAVTANDHSILQLNRATTRLS